VNRCRRSYRNQSALEAKKEQLERVSMSRMRDRKSASCLLAVTGILVAIVPQSRSVAITHVNVVDVIEGRILPNMTVTIGDATIATVTANGRPSPNARIVDGAGKFLIPGLWDMHAHMEASGTPWLALYVANGVTGIRDMGSNLDLILEMRESTASGRVMGPRIFAAGPILDDAPGAWPFRMRVRNSADGRAAVQLLKRRGVDLIKVHNHTPPDAYFAIAEEARRQNLPLAGHVPLKVTIEQAIEAGQNDIEHLSESRLWMECSGGRTYRREACRPLFEMLARRGIWQTPTLAASSEMATIGTAASAVPAEQLAYATKSVRAMWAENQGTFATPEVIRMFKERAEVAAAVTNDMSKAGVGILAGCDSLIAGFCVHDEVAAMVRGGMTPLAALQTATLNPARYFNRSQSAGSVAPGRRADLVLLDADPLTDIGNVRRIRAVVVAGRFLGRKELDTLLAETKLAATRK
jgi:amidohydrolase family protein